MSTRENIRLIAKASFLNYRLSLRSFIIFLDYRLSLKQITFKSGTLENTQTEYQKYFFFDETNNI